MLIAIRGDDAGVLYLARWAIYGFVFGYFYPRLRGNEPWSKALLLTTAALIPELLLLIEHPPSAIAREAGAVLAWAAISALGLGLMWELRLARAATIPWARIRGLRGLRSTLAPTVTFLVATVGSIVSAVMPHFLPPKK